MRYVRLATLQVLTCSSIASCWKSQERSPVSPANCRPAELELPGLAVRFTMTSLQSLESMRRPSLASRQESRRFNRTWYVDVPCDFLTWQAVSNAERDEQEELLEELDTRQVQQEAYIAELKARVLRLAEREASHEVSCQSETRLD